MKDYLDFLPDYLDAHSRGSSSEDYDSQEEKKHNSP
jgi:hypothetical protein